MEKRFVQVGDIRTCYLEGGVGKTLLLLHGWGLDGPTYMSLLEELEKGYRVIALDFPGFGESDPPPKAWDVGEYKHFVLKFLDHVEVNHFDVVAHSFGGRVALKLGAEDAERIKKMVLTGAAGIRPKKSVKRRVFSTLAKVGKFVFSLPILSRFQRSAKKLLYKAAREQDYIRTSGVMKKVFVKVIEEDLTPYLRDVRPEVLLLWGKNDTMTPLMHAELMEASMPQAELRVFDHVGHRLPYEMPLEVAKAIRKFV